MGAAENLDVVPLATWAEICEQWPDEWVRLVDVQHEPSGAIRSGRLLGHSSSMTKTLEQLGVTTPDQVVVHTGGRPLRSRRFEPIDEVRDLLRSRR